MADERFTGLTEVLAAELETLTSSLVLAVDDPSFSAGDAKKILIQTLLSNDIVTGNSNNYQALTPQGFYNSVGNTSRRGVHELASTPEIQGKSTSNVLTAANQAIMQSQWFEDWWIGSGIPTLYQADAEDTDIGAMIFHSTVNKNMVQYESHQINPTLPTGREFNHVQFDIAINTETLPNYNSVRAELTASGSTVYYWIPRVSCGVAIEADNRRIMIVNNNVADTVVHVAITCRCVII